MSNKQILIVADGDGSSATVVDDGFGDSNRVVVREIDPASGEGLRGYSPDLIILTTAVSAEVRQRILEPMTAIGGEIIELY